VENLKEMTMMVMMTIGIKIYSYFMQSKISNTIERT